MINYNTKLGKYFSFGEMIGYNPVNIPNELELIRLTQLSCDVLDLIRDEFGKIKVTSGYRNKKYNAEIGGAENSQHTKGEAADIIPQSADIFNVFKWCVENIIYDQIIYEEKVSKSGKVKKWIHISYKIEKNRNEALIYKDNTYSFYK